MVWSFFFFYCYQKPKDKEWVTKTLCNLWKHCLLWTDAVLKIQLPEDSSPSCYLIKHSMLTRNVFLCSVILSIHSVFILYNLSWTFVLAAMTNWNEYACSASALKTLVFPRPGTFLRNLTRSLKTRIHNSASTNSHPWAEPGCNVISWVGYVMFAAHLASSWRLSSRRWVVAVSLLPRETIRKCRSLKSNVWSSVCGWVTCSSSR